MHPWLLWYDWTGVDRGWKWQYFICYGERGKISEHLLHNNNINEQSPNFCLGRFRLYQCEHSQSDHKPCRKDWLHSTPTSQAAHTPSLLWPLLERHCVDNTSHLCWKLQKIKILELDGRRLMTFLVVVTNARLSTLTRAPPGTAAAWFQLRWQLSV